MLEALPLDIASQVADAPPAAQAAAAAATVAAVFSVFPQRRVGFSSIDQARAIAYLQSFPTGAFNLWSVAEWNRLGVKEKLDFGTTNLADGVRIDYFLTAAQARQAGLAGLQQDGGFELRIRGNSIVARADPGRINRRREEEVIWQRMVLQVTKGIAMERAGAMPSFGKPIGVYPCSMEREIAYMAQRRASDSLWKRY